MKYFLKMKLVQLSQSPFFHQLKPGWTCIKSISHICNPLVTFLDFLFIEAKFSWSKIWIIFWIFSIIQIILFYLSCLFIYHFLVFFFLGFLQMLFSIGKMITDCLRCFKSILNLQVWQCISGAFFIIEVLVCARWLAVNTR